MSRYLSCLLCCHILIAGTSFLTRNIEPIFQKLWAKLAFEKMETGFFLPRGVDLVRIWFFISFINDKVNCFE